MRSAHIKDTAQAQYLRVVSAHIRNGKYGPAYALLQHALLEFPDDPRILSYYGYMETVVNKKYWSGIENCRKALSLLASAANGEEAPYSLLYLNLGKAYIAAGQRKEGLLALYKGLKYERNADILKELQVVGMRAKPLLPFLDRSNLINKYAGIFIHRFKHASVRPKHAPFRMAHK